MGVVVCVSLSSNQIRRNRPRQRSSKLLSNWPSLELNTTMSVVRAELPDLLHLVQDLPDPEKIISEHVQVRMLVNLKHYIVPDDDPAVDKALRMMEKMGWTQGRGLGRDQQGIIQPIAAVGQVGRSGLGLNINVKGSKRVGRAGRKGMTVTEEEVATNIPVSVVVPSLEGEVPMKHPLHNTWTLWFFKNDKRFDWETNQRPVIEFATVEDFWALHNHIEPASRLQVGCDYSLFKKGIKPMWEDPMNKEGGRWLVNLDKPNTSRNVPMDPAFEKFHTHALDEFWTELLLLLIGEAFGPDTGELVNGAIVNIGGRGDKVSVWMSSSTEKEAILEVGRKIRHCTAMPDRYSPPTTAALDKKSRLDLVFENHQDNKNKACSRAKQTFKV